MFKKIILSLSFLLFMNNVFSMEFLGKQLENLNRTQLTNLLNENGATIINKENLVDTFSLKNSKIPYADSAKAYYNYQNEFVGLKIMFVQDEHNLVNLRKNLVEKYGNHYLIKDFFETKANHNELNADFFSDTALWKDKTTSIEFNANTFEQNTSVSFSSSAFLFFREISRRNKLVEQLKKDSKKIDDDKFKGVF